MVRLTPSLVLFQPHSNQHPIQHLVIQAQRIRNLVGFTENRLGFRSGVVGQVRQVLGERAVVQTQREWPGSRSLEEAHGHRERTDARVSHQVDQDGSAEGLVGDEGRYRRPPAGPVDVYCAPARECDDAGNGIECNDPTVIHAVQYRARKNKAIGGTKKEARSDRGRWQSGLPSVQGRGDRAITRAVTKFQIRNRTQSRS